MRNLYLYYAYIYTYFLFNYLVRWHCCVDRIVPEAIHYQVAIKLLVSGGRFLKNLTTVCRRKPIWLTLS